MSSILKREIERKKERKGEKRIKGKTSAKGKSVPEPQIWALPYRFARSRQHLGNEHNFLEIQNLSSRH